MKFGKYFFTLLLIGIGVSAWGQNAPTDAPNAAATANELPQIMTWVLASAGALLFVIAMLYVIRVNQFLYKRLLKLEAQKSGAILPDDEADYAAEAGDDFWTRLRKKYWENPVPIEKEGDIILHHDFDGIRELDNVLPPWWLNMFYLTIIWALGYMIYYHWGGNGPSQTDEYKTEMAVAQKEHAAMLATAANAIDESNVTMLKDAADLSAGETIFKTNCVTCHGPQAAGSNEQGPTLGPNLTDKYWIHGGGIKNVFKTIVNGVPDKGMISWKSQLKPSDIQKVGSYILSLQGTNPTNPKEPQGTLWAEEGAVASDSTGAATPAKDSLSKGK